MIIRLIIMIGFFFTFAGLISVLFFRWYTPERKQHIHDWFKYNWTLWPPHTNAYCMVCDRPGLRPSKLFLPENNHGIDKGYFWDCVNCEKTYLFMEHGRAEINQNKYTNAVMEENWEKMFAEEAEEDWTPDVHEFLQKIGFKTYREWGEKRPDGNLYYLGLPPQIIQENRIKAKQYEESLKFIPKTNTIQALQSGDNLHVLTGDNGIIAAVPEKGSMEEARQQIQEAIAYRTENKKQKKAGPYLNFYDELEKWEEETKSYYTIVAQEKIIMERSKYKLDRYEEFVEQHLDRYER